jgi:hypothetical protein
MRVELITAKQINDKLASLSVSELKEVVAGLFNDNREDAGIALDFATEALRLRMPSNEFVSFLDSIL